MQNDNNIKIINAEHIVNTGMEDIYSDVYKLGSHLGYNQEFVKLKSNKDFSSVAISFCPDVKGISWLLEELVVRITFGKKRGITNRKTGYLIFEYGLWRLEVELARISNIRILVDQINMLMGINGNFSIFGEEILTGDRFDRLILSLSPNQLERVRKIMKTLDIKTEGLVALICLIYTFNNAFGNGNWNGNNDTNDINFQLVNYYYIDDGIINLIRNKFKDCESRLINYLQSVKDPLREELQDCINIGKKSPIDINKITNIPILLERIDRVLNRKN